MRWIRNYTDSIIFPLSLGFLTLLGWVITFYTNNQNFYWPSAILISLLAFAPLFGRDGRGYLALIILVASLISHKLNFSTIQPAFIVMISSIFLSVIIFLIVRKPQFHLGRLFFPIIGMLIIFSLSLIFDLAQGHELHRESLWFLLGMYGILILYLFIVPMLFEENAFDYLAKVVVILGTVLAIEIFCYLISTHFPLLKGEDIQLGWVQSSTMASTLLVIAIPFTCMFFKEKKIQNIVYVIPLIAIVVSIFFLKTVSGLLATILIAIPLVFMVFKPYKYYPYLVISSLTILIGLSTLIFVLNDNYFNTLLNSLTYLRKFFDGAITEHQLGIEMFVQSPVLGPSINSLYDLFGSGKGYIRLLDNTVITTLVMGGSLGLICYFVHEINLYILVFQRKNPKRYFFLLFLLTGEIIGLIDNTLFNLMYMFILFLAVATYENSSRKPTITLTQNYFNYYKR